MICAISFYRISLVCRPLRVVLFDSKASNVVGFYRQNPNIYAPLANCLGIWQINGRVQKVYLSRVLKTQDKGIAQTWARAKESNIKDFY